MNDESASRLIAVHVCPDCGSAIERVDANPESLITGLIKCVRCGHEAPLNVEVRDLGDRKPPANINSSQAR